MGTKLAWCKKQKAGIRLTDPNDNLAREYYESAEDTIRDLNTNKTESIIWKATKKYYAEYYAAYAILMKLGIKSEIHECTIALIQWMEEEKILTFRLASILDEDKRLRIDNQYYLKNRPVPINPEQLATMLLNIKTCIDGLTPARIQEIRKKVEKA
ncbi:MAG: hypothetical protein V1743_04455 [Nanoarchaeota archaeon]